MKYIFFAFLFFLYFKSYAPSTLSHVQINHEIFKNLMSKFNQGSLTDGEMKNLFDCIETLKKVPDMATQLSAKTAQRICSKKYAPVIPNDQSI